MKVSIVASTAFFVILAGCMGKSVYVAEDMVREQPAKVLSAQELVEQGKAAADRKDWRQAISLYTQAQKRAHLSPQIMYNLAAAHDQAGNELMADVWFRAYLAAVPDAANASQVKAEIDRLEKAAEAKMVRLFLQAEQLAEQLPLRAAESYSKGRRADAFESIARTKVQIGYFSGAEDDLARMKRYAVSENPTTYMVGENNLSIYIETLALAGDIEGAMAVRDKIKDDFWRKSAAVYILAAAIRCDDSKLAKKLLSEKCAPDNIYSSYSDLALMFAKEGDLATAETFLMKETGDWRWGCVSMSEWLLSKGNIYEGVRFARLAGKPAEAMVIRGEIEGAFRELSAGEKTSLFDPSGVYSSLNRIVKCSIYMDDMYTARRAVSLSDEFIEKGVPLIDSNKNFKRALIEKESYVLYAKGRAAMGRAYLDLENGNADSAVKRVFNGSRLYNLYEDGKGKLKVNEVQSDAYRFAWLCQLCDFAISRNKLDGAEQVADSFIESRQKIEYLKQILNLYEAKNDAANKERLRQKLAGLSTDVRLGWFEMGSGREEIINAWADAATELNMVQAVSDLQTYLSEDLKRNPEDAPSGLAHGAKDLGAGLIRIRALGRRYP